MWWLPDKHDDKHHHGLPANFIGDCSPQIGDDALVDLVTEIETNVFGDKVPVKFAWTAYEKAFKTYSKSHM